MLSTTSVFEACYLKTDDPLDHTLLGACREQRSKHAQACCMSTQRHSNAKLAPTNIVPFCTCGDLLVLCSNYLPRPMPPCCAICAFCSWNLSPNRSELFKNLSTHRITHCSSLPNRLFDVKSLTQSLKHRCTRFEYIYAASVLYVAKGASAVMHTFIKSFICFLSIRPCSSRCSAALSLMKHQLLFLPRSALRMMVGVTDISMPLILG